MEDLSEANEYDWRDRGEVAAKLEKLEAEFKCLLCQDFLDIPLQGLKCGHVFCSECIRRALMDTTKQRCPHCRSPLTTSDLRSAPMALQAAVIAWRSVRPQIVLLTRAGALDIGAEEEPDDDFEIIEGEARSNKNSALQPLKQVHLHGLKQKDLKDLLAKYHLSPEGDMNVLKNRYAALDLAVKTELDRARAVGGRPARPLKTIAAEVMRMEQQTAKSKRETERTLRDVETETGQRALHNGFATLIAQMNRGKEGGSSTESSDTPAGADTTMSTAMATIASPSLSDKIVSEDDEDTGQQNTEEILGVVGTLVPASGPIPSPLVGAEGEQCLVACKIAETGAWEWKPAEEAVTDETGAGPLVFLPSQHFMTALKAKKAEDARPKRLLFSPGTAPGDTPSPPLNISQTPAIAGGVDSKAQGRAGVGVKRPHPDNVNITDETPAQQQEEGSSSSVHSKSSTSDSQSSSNKKRGWIKAGGAAASVSGEGENEVDLTADDDVEDTQIPASETQSSSQPPRSTTAWQCNQCTFIEEHKLLVCGMCGAANPNKSIQKKVPKKDTLKSAKSTSGKSSSAKSTSKSGKGGSSGGGILSRPTRSSLW